MRVNRKRILTVLIILTLCFIWGHSLMSREDSSNESGWVTGIVTPLLELFVGKGNVTEHLVRKLAHFCEYALLGAELFCYFTLRDLNGSRRFLHSGLLAEAHVMFTAMVDETIQIFSGRGSQLQDVWLDSAGGVAGILFAALMLLLFSCTRKNN